MAGPSVMVRVLADLTGMSIGFQNAADKGRSMATGMHSAFSGALGALNQTGVLGPFGTALATADASLQAVSKHGKETGSTMLGIGGAVAGLGVALTAMGSKDQAAHQQLQAAVKATGHSYDEYAGKVEEAVKHEEHFGTTANQTQDALRVLTQATHSPTEALKLLNTTTDLAAAKHEDLTTAATQMAKAYNGNARILKEFGITMTATANPAKELEKATRASTSADDELAKAKQHLADVQLQDAASKTHTVGQAIALRDAEEKVMTSTTKAAKAHADLTTAQHAAAAGAKGHEQQLDLLGKKLSGQASASANTFTGHLHAMKAAIEDHVATLGKKYGPALTAAGTAVAGLGAAVQLGTTLQLGSKIASAASTVATIAMAAAEGVATAAQWALNVAMEANPLVLIVTLIIGAIAAIVAIGIKFGWWKDIGNALWVGLQAAFHGIWAAIKFVWDWIQENWPLLVGMLFGPFGVAVALIVTHWQTVVDFFRGLPGTIKGFFGDALGWLEHVGEDIITGLWNGMKAIWNKVTGWFSGLTNAVPAVLKKAWGILSPSTVFHDIGANLMHGLANGIEAGYDQHVATALTRTVGALSSSMPGGASGPGGGASRTPVPTQGASSSAGASIAIEHAHFGNELDADAWLRQMAFRMRAAQL